MPATQYKIWQMGNSVGSGATGAVHVGIHGIAKTNNGGIKNVVSNEFIRHALASIILLPIPVGFLMQDSGTTYYVSGNFQLSGEGLPPADSVAITSEQPSLSNGIILFDTWIMNGDRHTQNIAYDTTTKKIQIFDHSHALLGTQDNILNNWEQKKASPCLGGHCLSSLISNLDGMIEWYDRIINIPEYYIREVFKDGLSVEGNENISDDCSNFMLERRNNLLKILKQNAQSVFPQVPEALWESISN